MAGPTGETIMLDASILFALCALIIYGLTQVVSKHAVGSLNATSMVAINFVVSLPIFVVFLVSTLLAIGKLDIHFEYIVYGIIGASTARAGYYIYLEALEKGAVTMVGSITAAYPAITAVLAVMLLDERIKPTNAVGISIIVASMVTLSFFRGRQSEKSGLSRPAFLLSLATFFLWGVGGIFIKLALSGLPQVVYLAIYPFILPPIALLYLRHKGATRSVFSIKWTVPVMIAVMAAMLWQLGYFAETAALSRGAASIVFPLISSYPVVTIAAAHVTLGERLSRIEWLLLFAVVAGIVLTSLV